MIQYTYDEAGNRATMTENGTLTTYTYDANNRMTAEQTGLNVKTFLYDANGNQLSAMYNFNFAGAYTYNLFGHQTSYTPDEAGYTYYTYRADGLRHSVGDTVHIWDGTDIVADIDGNVSTIYFRGISLIFSETAGVRTYYHQNAHGDVIMLTDGQGNIIKTYEYDAFGIEWDAVDTDNNPFRYCGEYFDKETKTVYLRARYYDSAYGRFTQQDGWEYANYGDPLSLNLYTYCANNPVLYVDESGNSWISAAIESAKSAIKGAVKAGIQASIHGKNVFWSTVSGAVTGAIAGFCDGLFDGVPIVDQIVGILGDGVSSAVGNLFNQLIDGKSLSEVDYKECLYAGITGCIESIASFALDNLIAQKVAESINSFIDWFYQIFEQFTGDSTFAKEVVSFISEMFFAQLPVNVVSALITEGGETNE